MINLHNLIDASLSLIPIAEGKKNPHHILGKGHNLLDTRSTHEELDKWLSIGVSSWGLANGAVSSNLVTLDFDEKHYDGLYDLFYQKLSEEQKEVVDKCVINRTRNRGTHVRYFTETPQPTTKLSLRVIGEKIETTSEVRGQGSYALIPPSEGYSFIQGELTQIPKITDDLHEQFTDIMRIFNEVFDEPATEYEYSASTATGDRPGDLYNATATWFDILVPHGWVEEYKDHWRRPGKKEGEGISATTNYDGRPMFYVFSTASHPFKENTGYSKFHAYALLNHGGDFSKASKELLMSGKVVKPEADINPKKDNQADKLIEIVEGKEKVTLFHDEKGEAYISVKIGDHQETMSMKSKIMRKWLTKEFWDKYKKSINPDSVKGAIAVLEGKACFDGPSYELHNRLAWNDNNLWYDLTNNKWQAIKINEDGWIVVNQSPILFSRYSHSRPQVMPSVESGDIRLILKYVNITDSEQQLLLLIYLVSCFIPDFPHPILVIFGSQGSAKSTLSKLLRRIVDPSQIEVASMPDNYKELVQALAHHVFLFFDNVSYISEQTSDVLCKAITGSGFVKRELYTDDEDIIYNFKRCIGINGINLVSTKPDLLDRSLLLELERIDDSKRKQEKDLMDDFEKDLPYILRGIFDALSKTVKLKPSIKLTTSPRMADFALWGCAIAEAIGHTQQEFIYAYQNNIDKQKETILNENIIAMVLMSFMEERMWERWEGTMSELLERLTQHAPFANIETREKHWPKAPNILSRAINVLKTTLRSADVSIVNTSTGQIRKVTIEKIGKSKEYLNDSLTTGSLLVENDTYDTDDVSRNLLEEDTY